MKKTAKPPNVGTTSRNNKQSTESSTKPGKTTRHGVECVATTPKGKQPIKSRISLAEAAKLSKSASQTSSLKSSKQASSGQNGSKTVNSKGDESSVSKKTTSESNAKPEQKDEFYEQIEKALQREKKSETSLFQKRNSNAKRVRADGSTNFVYHGDVSVDLPNTSKVVRIFTSSTFTDTQQERNWLLGKTYPKIKSFCQARGYDFQVVDMRWGIRDEATDDHMGTDLCLRELSKCKEISTGPFFVTLLSHKYGYRALPREIDAAEFEKLLENVKITTKKDLLRKWYTRDDNSVPPVYVLQSISKHLPDFSSEDIELRTKAKKAWWEENDAMQDILEEAAISVLGEKAAEKYIISVSEKEIKNGMLDVKNANRHCLWFKRNICNIDKLEKSQLLSRYTECFGTEAKVQKAKKLIKELEERKIPSCIAEKNIMSYSVEWTEKGISVENKDHKVYLEKMAADFEKCVCDLIEDGIKERETGFVEDDVLFEECLQHLRFCHEKSKDFHGRTKTMKAIETYMKSKTEVPLIIHGKSGSGKTSIIAQTAKMSASWFEDIVVVMRFIGTTPKSSNIISLLRSLCRQIKLIYEDSTPTSEDLKELVQEFKRCLTLPETHQKLLILLDSLDQLDPSNEARQLLWIPQQLKPNVRFIVSTLEENVYECFPCLKSLFPTSDNYTSIPRLPTNDVQIILDSWLKKKCRTLTQYQRELLLETFDECPLPLNLKLSFDEACRWQSYADKSTTRLQNTIRNSINRLFFRMEKMHGELFVSRALGYMTTAKNGLSEGELEDILACDDDVLNEIYMYWTPPSRRLPPLLLVRLRADLSEYLVERGADRLRVISWYHRQFIEAARERYCQDHKFVHRALAEFFAGTWANGNKKPFTDKSGKQLSEERFVTAQPLLFGSTFNYRKLNNLPYHRIKSGDIKAAKTECLCNFRFIFSKLLATSYRHVIDDFDLASKEFKDYQIQIITDALQLSEHALIYDKMLLVPQLKERLAEEKEVTHFLAQMSDYPFPYLSPCRNMLMKPGGSLINVLTGHTSVLRGLDLKRNGTHAVTNSDFHDGTVKLWDVKNAKMIKSFDGLGNHPSSVRFVANDSLILVHCSSKLVAIKETGDVVYTIPTQEEKMLYCVTGKDKENFAVFFKRNIEIYCAYKGKRIDTIETAEGIEFETNGIAVGSKTFIAVTAFPRDKICIIDLFTKKITLYVVPFPENDTVKHVIRSFVITPEERTVIFSIKFENDIRFLDIKSMQETRCLKGDKKDFSGGKFVLSPDGNNLFYPVAKSICVWDLKSESWTYKYNHPAYVHGIASIDWKTMVTISNDPNVRVWDLTREHKKEEQRSRPVGYHLRHIGFVSNPRYAIALSQMTSDPDSHAVTVIDLEQNILVRKYNLNDQSRLFQVISDKEVVLCSSDRKLKILNTESSAITKTFQGKMFQCMPFVSYDYNQLCFLPRKREIITVTRGRHHLKIYDVDTGKTKTIIKLKGDIDCKLTNLQPCKDESAVVAFSTDEKYFIFDMEKKKMDSIITSKDINSSSIFPSATMTDNGKVLLFFGIPQSTETPFSFVIYSTKGKGFVDVDDNGYPRKTWKSSRADSPNATNIENWGFATSYLDGLVRVWDADKGHILYRLEGHLGSVSISPSKQSVNCNPWREGPFLVTNNRKTYENAFRVWRIDTMECVASYKLDGSESVLMEVCNDIGVLLSVYNLPTQVNHWTVKGTKYDMDLSKSPIWYKAIEKHDITINDTIQTDNDESDPDDDEDEKDEFDDDD